MQMARKPLALFVVANLAFVPGIAIPSIRNDLWTLAVPTAMLAVLIVTLIWPSGGLRGYFSYRTPVVVAAFVAELWIVVGGLALQLPSGIILGNILFSVFLGVFFLLTTINSLPGIVGEYRRGVLLRPDLIFGAGAYLVRGEIFVALGIEFLTSPKDIEHPIWNWWALTAEVSAMLMLIAGRGILKMQMRRARFLGLDNWMGSGLRVGLWVREVFLFVALFWVIYAFANMFGGLVPFTWQPGDPQGTGGSPQWWGFAWLAASFVVLVPLRGWWKTRLPEPPTVRQELAKQMLMWIGFVFLIYGFILVFDGSWRGVGCCDYFNFWWGAWVSLLGFLMVVPLRVLTLGHEFRGTVRIMTATIGDLPDEQRRELLGRRLATVAAMPERERRLHLREMMSAVERQPEERRQGIMRTREAVLEELPPPRRSALEQTSTAILAERDA